MKTVIAYSFCLLTLFILLLSLWGFYSAIRPTKITSNLTPKMFGVNYESIQFITKDHVLIKGWFIPNKNPHAKTIILLHGYPADKGDILPSRLFLHHDYNLLFFDFRYFGESQSRYSTIGKNEVLDLAAAIDYLHSRGINEVGIWGLSLGGAVALSISDPRIKAIVSEAPYARLDWMADDHYRIPGLNRVMGHLLRLWGWVFLDIDIKSVQPAKMLSQSKIPLLLIYSKQDQVIPYRHALLMQQEARNNPHVEFIILNQGNHGELLKQYQTKIKDFFAHHLQKEP